MFTPALRSEIVSMLEETLRITDVLLIAFAIMPNHLHVLVQHRLDSLGKFMQRFLTRVARRTQKRHGIMGHVFEKTFCHEACLSPRHLRNAIAYTNLNAVRAGLCLAHSDYEWCSSLAYSQPERSQSAISRHLHRPYWLFATPSCRTPADEIQAYNAHLRWRLDRDQQLSAGGLDPDLPPEPPISMNANQRWLVDFPPLFQPQLVSRERPSEDLRDIARRSLFEAGNSLSLEEFRNARRSREYVELRRAVIRRMSMAGYTGKQIAEFFGMTQGGISRALACTRAVKAIE